MRDETKLREAVNALIQLKKAYKKVHESDKTEIGQRIGKLLNEITNNFNFIFKMKGKALELLEEGKIEKSIQFMEDIIKNGLSEAQQNLGDLMKLNGYLVYFVRQGFGR